jgi:transposase
MSKPLVEDALWELIAPLLPPPKPRPYRHPGRKPLDNRAVLSGILFVLRSGIPWEMLPRQMGCGCGMTCWRRLRDWHQAGVWEQIHRILLEKLQTAHQIDWSRASVDSGSIRAVGAGEKNRAEPDRPGQKRQQASYYRRRGWDSFVRQALRGQRTRLADVLGLSGWHTRPQRRVRQTAKKTHPHLRRQSV